ncbi:MAG: type I-E CRISPR-associated protein Cas6/Cse3/CasE [Kiloniellales bacterium]|nr:type I-E CRISPR-associated protein Cas6/Cse3/CasE [Kiloniellales bacterium]
MTASLYFSRARLRRDASVAALLPLLGFGGSRKKVRPDASHALVWSLFADGPERRRDFLYRESEAGRLYILSARPPEDRHALFELDCKPYALNLLSGDRLAFSLRANPVVRRKSEDGKNAAKHDVVMDALHSIGSGPERAEQRSALIRRQGLAWLQRVGARSGFTPIEERLAVDGYRQHRLPRPDDQKDIKFSTLDFDGLLTVGEPERFAAAVAAGFGAARAFGCGLMLLRRG